MGNFRMKFNIEGEELAADEIERIGERATHARPALAVINRMMIIGAHEQFGSEGARGGYSWLQDKPETIAKKRAAGQDERTERRERDLEASLLLGSKGNINRISDKTTTYGTRLFYAKFQGHKRQLLKVTYEDADRWTSTIVHWIISGQAVEMTA